MGRGQTTGAGYAQQHKGSQGPEQRRVQQGSHNHQPGLRKRIYFLSGFDPRGSSFYYRLFVEQLQAYAVRNGRQLAVGRRRGQKDPLVSSWQVEEAGRSVLEVCFLHWDDIARQNWPKNPLRLIWDGVGMYAWYLLGGGFLQIVHWSPNSALCGMWPLIFFSFWVTLISVVNLVVSAFLSPWLAPIVAAAMAAVAWRLAELQGVVWLWRSIRFTHRLGQARDSALRKRLQDLAGRIVAIERDAPAQRVQLVGHSSGSFVMAMLAAELRRQPGFEADLQPRLSLLSLGQNLANLAVHRGAVAFHNDLRTLAAVPRLPWRDITSRHDYLCFAAVDPYRSCGLQADPPAYPQLELINLAQRLGLGSWWALITNQFPLHFQYLHTAPPALQGGFDYFEELLGEIP